jgi:hypothetical protein
MPAKVAAAIVQVARGIRAVAKNGTNEHGKYMFASVDDFYNMVGPIMAEAGLFTLADVSRCEISETETTDNYNGKVKRNSYLNMEFDICFVHESGEMSMPVKREVTVIASGPQAYAAAESFVTKYFIRNMFKIPTGDYDADSDDKVELPAKAASKPATKAAAAPKQKGGEPAKVPASAEAEEPKIKAAMEPVLEFVAKVNEFLDTDPDAGALFAFEGADGINARMKKIRGDQYSAVPAVQELLKRMNAVYATAPEREPGEEG